MTNVLRLCSILLALLAPAAGLAQQVERPNGVFLVAKPGLQDPNFSETVVLVTQTADSGTVGVIVNRPSALDLRQLLPDSTTPGSYRDPVFFGGPVMRQAIVALLRAEAPPAGPAFHVLKDLYLTMHADNILPLLQQHDRQYRLYAGFAAWAPRQLESEFMRDGWYVVPADAATVFRGDVRTLWEELVRRAQTRPVSSGGTTRWHQ